MYEIFEQLCKEKGVTAYKVCKVTGITTTCYLIKIRGIYIYININQCMKNLKYLI